jgi:DNA ligase-1
MKFETVADFFDRIEAVSGRLEITKLLAELLREATPEEASVICNLSLGQLNPPYIGTQFNIATKNLIKVVALLRDLPESQVAQLVKEMGDIGLVAANQEPATQQDLAVQQSLQENLQQNLFGQQDLFGMSQPELAPQTSSASESSIAPVLGLEIMAVYEKLREIEALSGSGSQEEKIQQLVALLKNMSPNSAKFVLRIILGKLRLGFSDMTLIDALSWMRTGDKSLHALIEDAYNRCADLGLIASIFKKEGVQALENMQVHVGIPIRPASAERAPTAQAIIEKIGPSVAQPKLDGFRVQIHINKTGIKPVINFFSRNLQDMSAMFPDLVPVLAELPVESIICEGEAITFDQSTGTFLPFQETAKRKRKHDIESAAAEFPLKLFIFDILYLNGENIMHLTHEQRRAELLKIFETFDRSGDLRLGGHEQDTSHDQKLVQVIDEVFVSTGKELENYFLTMVAAGLEGLVVKRPDTHYQPGKRNFNWIKLKRQEEGHLEDTVDCAVLGYYAGAGKRAAFGIGAFLVGVYNPDLDSFQTVAKIGTGLKDAEWRELKVRCDALAVKEKPHNVICPKELTPDVWVVPELVCLVRADEITLSPVHTAGKTDTQLGYALRFPRIMGYREDKKAELATTAHEIARLYQDQFISPTSP